MTLSSGTLGGAGALTVDGTLTWSGGTMSGGTTVAQGGGLRWSQTPTGTPPCTSTSGLWTTGAPPSSSLPRGATTASTFPPAPIFDNQAAGSFDFQGDNLLVEESAARPPAGRSTTRVRHGQVGRHGHKLRGPRYRLQRHRCRQDERRLGDARSASTTNLSSSGAVTPWPPTPCCR